MANLATLLAVDCTASRTYAILLDMENGVIGPTFGYELSKWSPCVPASICFARSDDYPQKTC